MSAKFINVFNIKKLIVFHAVVEYGSVTRAAKLMNRSQGQLSSIVKELEEACGANLLERHPGGVELTATGEIFLQCAKSYIEAYHAFSKSVQQLSGHEKPPVVLYAPPGMIQFISEYGMHLFHAVHPDVSLVMIACHFGECEDYDHLFEEADIIISFVPSPHPDAVNRKVEWEVGFFASPDYQASTPLASPQDLSSERCITVVNYGVGSNSWTYREDGEDHLIEVFGKIQTNDISSAVAMAKKGLGVIFVPAMVAQRYVDDGSLVRVVPAYYGCKPCYIIYKKQGLGSKTVLSVRSFLCEFMLDAGVL